MIQNGTNHIRQNDWIVLFNLRLQSESQLYGQKLDDTGKYISLINERPLAEMRAIIAERARTLIILGCQIATQHVHTTCAHHH